MDNIISIKRKPDNSKFKKNIKDSKEVIKDLKLLFQVHADRERRIAEERALNNKKIIIRLTIKK